MQIYSFRRFGSHFGRLGRPFVIKKEEVASAALPDAENDWSTDDWDEGWERLQEVPS